MPAQWASEAPPIIGQGLRVLTQEGSDAIKGELDTAKELDAVKALAGDSGDQAKENEVYFRRRHLGFKERIKEKQAEEQ